MISKSSFLFHTEQQLLRAVSLFSSTKYISMLSCLYLLKFHIKIYYESGIRVRDLKNPIKTQPEWSSFYCVIKIKIFLLSPNSIHENIFSNHILISKAFLLSTQIETKIVHRKDTPLMHLIYSPQCWSCYWSLLLAIFLWFSE